MDQILLMLSKARIIPVVVIDDADKAHGLASALVEGGLPLAEVTLRTNEAIKVIRTFSQRGDVLVGAGTVTSSIQVDAAFKAGASFIVSPGYLDLLSRELKSSASWFSQEWPPQPK